MTYYSETPREGISLPDGTFKGVLKDGKPSWGTLTDLYGIIYEGEFQDGKIQGKGIMTFPEGQRYEGDFVNEKFEGSGMYTWPNGNRYEGQFANGKFEGRGIYTWANGERYEGDFVNGEQHELSGITPRIRLIFSIVDNVLSSIISDSLSLIVSNR